MENATAADSSQSNVSRILHLKRQLQKPLLSKSSVKYQQTAYRD